MKKYTIPILVILLFIIATIATVLNISTKTIPQILINPVFISNILLIISSVILQSTFHNKKHLKNIFSITFQVISLLATCNTAIYATTRINIQINNQYQTKIEQNYNYILNSLKSYDSNLFSGK